MKKSLLIIPLLLMGSFAFASEDFPAFPMTLHGNIKIWSTNLEWWTLKVYTSNQELASYDITEKGKYWSDNVSILPLLLNEFDWKLDFKVSYNWKNYVVDSIDDSNRWSWCPSKDSITFVSENCRYDITLKEETSNLWGGSSSWGWRSGWWGWWGWWGWSTSSKVTTGSSNATTGTNSSSDKEDETPVRGGTSAQNQSSAKRFVRNYSFSEWNPRDILQNWYTREQNNAYNFAYAYWITTMWDISKANMNWYVTRIAIAKMLSKYAINVLGREPDTSLQPYFLDIPDSLDQKYDNWVTLAYQLWIMWIWIKNFRPYDNITRAEFWTVLSRLVYRIQDWDKKYYSTHLAKLKKEWIITNDDPTIKEKRWNIMIMLMRTVK